MVALGRLLRGDQQYADPAGRYVAAYATPWRRVAAGAIDWTLCYVAFLLVSIPLGALQALGSVSWREGDFGGLEFHGHAQSGYDPRKGKYVGTWIDTMSTSLMTTEGTYDEATESLTMFARYIDPSGQEFEQRMVTTYEDGGRVMTMSLRPEGSDDEFVKMMQITYTKRSDAETKR